MRLVAMLAAALTAVAFASTTTHAQEWPAKPVRVVVPFPAGGSTDRMTRLVADELTKVFKQQFVVENRPGAGGAVGAAQVARAEADGYTLMAGGFGPHILGPASGVKADYDPIADFTHIVMMGGETYIFGAHSALGVKTITDVVRLANDKPVNVGSPGTGTLGQLMVDQFRLKVGGNRINHVPYRGGAPLQTDFIGNHVSLASLPIAPMLPHIATGTVVALAVSSSERNPALPDAPTLKEAGYPEIGGAIWFWLAGPKNLPEPIVDRVNKEVRRYLATAPVQQIFMRDALMRMDTDAAALNRFIAGEIKRWSAIYREIEPQK
ncbi:MAG TPA: tripartite tricarboxylate transporter substrate binding protein [Xanthobacteraceae bacterium]|nr:tripartite tricarboxylate transporter substrate binding protein [Xanthobacteraceae bacterium]